MKFAQKINKIPKFYNFAREMPEFYIIIARKYFSQILGGMCAPARAAPISYVYDTGISHNENF